MSNICILLKKQNHKLKQKRVCPSFLQTWSWLTGAVRLQIWTFCQQFRHSTRANNSHASIHKIIYYNRWHLAKPEYCWEGNTLTYFFLSSATNVFSQILILQQHVNLLRNNFSPEVLTHSKWEYRKKLCCPYTVMSYERFVPGTYESHCCSLRKKYLLDGQFAAFHI